MTDQVDQPKPTFTLNDLDSKLTAIYAHNLKFAKHHQDFLKDSQYPEEQQIHQGFLEANSMLQELIAIVTQKRTNLEAIDILQSTSEVITNTLDTEKPEFSVVGVQLFENGKLTGTSLYSTVVKARKIRDILNQRFAQLRVNHLAKIVNYSVF